VSTSLTLEKLVPTWNATASDHVAHLEWNPVGDRLASLPSQGPILVLDAAGRTLASLPEHAMGNGWATWHPTSGNLATAGYDGAVRLYSADHLALLSEKKLGRGWIEHIRWSADGKHLAASLGKELILLEAHLETTGGWTDGKHVICDFAWNPHRPGDIATVGGTGARMWRIGEPEPFAHFDWGGASLLAAWSPDGRWLATGDQTPSVHVYDFTRDHPLHIQGYETKVKTIAFSPTSKHLATGGGPLVTVWNCTGKTGPENTMPRQLEGHDSDVSALAYDPAGKLLASGGLDGRLLIFEPATSVRPRAAALLGEPVSSLAWHPAGDRLAAATASGQIALVTF